MSNKVESRRMRSGERRAGVRALAAELRRAGLLAGAAALLLLGVGLVALRAMAGAANVAQRSVGDILASSQYLGNALAIETAVLGYAVSGDAAFLQPYATGQLAAPEAQARLRAAAGSAAEVEQVRQAASLANTWETQWVEPTMVLIEGGGRPTEAQILQGKADLDALRETVASLQSLLVQQEVGTQAAARRDARWAAVAFGAAGLALLGLAFSVSGGLAHRVLRRLAEAREAADRLADGDFRVMLAEEGDDEIAALGRAFNAMVCRLAQAQTREAEALDAARAESGRLQVLLRSVPVGVVMTDATHRLISANPQAARMFGLDPGSLGGARARDVLAAVLPVLAPACRERLTELVAEIEGGRLEGAHLRLETLAPEARSLDLFAEAIHAADGRLLGDALTLVDRTAEQAAAEAKSRFIAAVSHELRTPLTAISGYVDLLLDGDAGPLTGEQTEFLGIVRQNTARLGRLVDELLDVEGLASGRLTLQVRSADLRAIVQRVAATFAPQAGRARLRLTTRLSDVPPILADPERLEQVLSNLVSNALKYTDSGGVRIEAGLSGDAATVAVIDSGLGMSPETVARLGEPFFRADDAAVRARRGTGLGFAITRGLVELQGGTMVVRSRLAGGTTVTITLPLASAAGAPDAAGEVRTGLRPAVAPGA